jgi:hypothetical protein
MGQGRGKVGFNGARSGAFGAYFGVLVFRYFCEAGLAPLNAARTSQRDVPTTGAKGWRPGFKFQVYFFPVAKLDHHPQLSRKSRKRVKKRGVYGTQPVVLERNAKKTRIAQKMAHAITQNRPEMRSRNKKGGVINHATH